MMEIEDFRVAVTNAYENLYNIPYLQGSVLLDYLIPDNTDLQDRARQLKRLLLSTIDNVYPGDNAPITSREWRLHRLLALRYVEGSNPQQIADQLAISLRHYYREQKDAIELLVNLLWKNMNEGDSSTKKLQRSDLVHLEAQRFQQNQPGTDLETTLIDVISLFRDIAEDKSIGVDIELQQDLSGLNVSQQILRQILVEVFNVLLKTNVAESKILVRSIVQPETLICRFETAVFETKSVQSQLDTIHHLSKSSNVTTQIEQSDIETIIELHIPILAPKVVLLVDDNEDFIELVSRYLFQYGYQYVIARTGKEAIDKARTINPDAIILDVMIPEPDGWSVLQTLHNHHETFEIPIIVTTVLSASELAMALGAVAFLSKPISEVDLMNALSDRMVDKNG